MPPLEAFPKSQQVTFKYYEGVLRFLEEDYVQVKRLSNHQKIVLLTEYRQRST